MATDSMAIKIGQNKQALKNGDVHNWYRFVLSFPDHLVEEMCTRFQVSKGDLVLDPFCGTGTTLVECKRMGIDSVGIEANPACVFATRVKTNWTADPRALRDAARGVINRALESWRLLSESRGPLYGSQRNIDELKDAILSRSEEGRYFLESGMIDRGWISEVPFFKTLVLLECIKDIKVDEDIRDLLRLALASILVGEISNVHFAPELSVDKRKKDVDVAGSYRRKIERIANDLEKVQELSDTGVTRVFQGDSRDMVQLLKGNGIESVDYVITSPPYPTEKDYTRQTRMELVLLGFVRDTASLRDVKRQMIRSHSKGIYKGDTDGMFVSDVAEVQSIVEELRLKTADKEYGFAKQYPKIVDEYFGGMHRHLTGLYDVLNSHGKCAYVVGEQRTYLQTYIPTGKILGILAERIGFKIEDLLVWRMRKGTTGSRREIKEEILILKKD